jgi:hypothetical protein
MKQERFCELLERVGDLTPDEDRELTKLSCELDALDWVDAQIREGFQELERTGKLERLH